MLQAERKKGVPNSKDQEQSIAEPAGMLKVSSPSIFLWFTT